MKTILRIMVNGFLTHDKKEHLLEQQHQQTVAAGDMEREFSLDYDTEECRGFSNSTSLKSTSNTVTDLMTNIKLAVKKREIEYKNLQINLQEVRSKHVALYQQLCSLKDREKKLENDLLLLKEKEKETEGRIRHLWQVPHWFITTNIKSEIVNEDTI